MIRAARITIGFVFAIVLFVSPGLAEKRVALVVGNNDYANVIRLHKAVNDATTMSQTLRSIGFDVTEAINVSRRDMNFAVQGFVNQIEPGDIAMVFFAGHGVEIRGENFLLPVDIPDATPGQEDFVKGEAISLNDILLRLKRRKARLNIVILDACRDNPFTRSAGRSLGASRGLARVSAPKGTFVMYSADAGEQALDRLNDNDRNANSVFTRTLVPMLKQPGLDLVSIARETRRKVRKLALGVSHEQTPAYYDAVLGDFFFTSKGPAPVEPPQTSGNSIDNDYRLAEKIGSKQAWQAFLSKYGSDRNNFYVKLAEAALQKLAVGVTPEPETGGELPPPANEGPPQPEELTLQARVMPVGKWPEGIGFDGRYLWVAESGQRQLARLDPKTGQVAGRVKVGRLPVSVAVTSRGTVYTAVATDKKIWRQPGPGRRGRSLTRLRDYPQAMVGDDRALWVLTWIGGSSAQTQVVRIDLATGRKTRSTVLPGNGFDLALQGNRIWTMHRQPGSRGQLLALDKTSLQVVGQSDYAGFTHVMAASQAGVFVAGGQSGRKGMVIKMDARSGREIARRDFEGHVSAVAAFGKYVIAMDQLGIISVLTAGDFQLVRKIRLTYGAFSPRAVIVTANSVIMTTHKGRGSNGSVLVVNGWQP